MSHIRYRKVLLVLVVAIAVIFTYPSFADCDDRDNFYLVWPVVSNRVVQPIAVKDLGAVHELELQSCVSEEGYVIEDVQAIISPILINDYHIVNIDVSSQRIAILCSDTDGKLILRVAEWDKTNCTYLKTDTHTLPMGSYLDMYHDGDSICLCVPHVEVLDSQSSEIAPSDFVFLTFQRDNGEWVLTAFTDGQSFFADLVNYEYVFNDYYQPCLEYEKRIQTIVYLEDFDFASLFQIINLYFSDR